MGARTRVPIKGDLRCLVLQEHSFAGAECHDPSYKRSLITSHRSLMAATANRRQTLP
jgi:hypothetical protein